MKVFPGKYVRVLFVGAVALAGAMLLSCGSDVSPTTATKYEWRSMDTSGLADAGIHALKNISGAASDFVFAVGDDRLVAQRSNGKWRIACCDVTLGTFAYNGISVYSENYAVVVGEIGQGAEYIGGGWSTRNWLQGRRVWAAGVGAFVSIDYASPKLMFRYDDASPYTLATLPCDYLFDIWGSRTYSDFPWYVVGSGGCIFISRADLQTWDAMDSGVTTDLLSIWGVQGTAFAVGDAGVVLRLSGDTWNKEDSGVDVSLRGVWADAPNDAYAVGAAGTILHFDGTSWSRVKGIPTTADLYDVWGSSAHDVVAVGQDTDTHNAVILQYGPVK